LNSASNFRNGLLFDEKKLMDETLKNIVDRIVQHINPTKIYLFGSRANGNQRTDSDYDIVLLYDGDKSKRETSVGVHKLFRRPQFSMDLFVLTSQEFESNKHLANTIAREVYENGVVIYG